MPSNRGSDESDRPIQHEEMGPEDWFDVVEGGETAVYFQLAADDEWWFTHDPEGRYPEAFEGPWQLWTTYPTGPWRHAELSRPLMEHHLEEIYWVHDPEKDSDIYRSKAVGIEDAPDFVKRQVPREDTSE